MAILRSLRRLNDFPAKCAQARVRLFPPAIADKVPGVVGQLEDPDAEGVKGVDEVEIGLDRIAALKVESDGEFAVLLGQAKIGNGGGRDGSGTGPNAPGDASRRVR